MIWYNEDFLRLAWSTPQHHSWALVFCRHQQELWQSRPELIAARAEAHQTPWHRREVVTHVCFLNTSALQARAVRSRDETGEAAGAHIVHPSPSKDHCLKGLQSGFRSISWIFHVISTIQGKHYVTCASQVEDLDLRDLDDLFWWQKKTTGIQRVAPLPSWNAGVPTFLFPLVFFFFSRRNSAGPKWRCAELGVSLADFNKFAKLFKAYGKSGKRVSPIHDP